MGKYTRKCIVCGQEYEYCPRCRHYDNLPKWYTLYHDENCKKIFDTLTDYNCGAITEKEAKKALKSCDMSRKEFFTAHLRGEIDNLIGNEEEAPRKVFSAAKAPQEK